ncbi:MAG: hypothetical protein IPI62_14560 [Bacteroidetes bacterium]|nr:hypothetical protein [Bacteroidota bacterium]
MEKKRICKRFRYHRASVVVPEFPEGGFRNDVESEKGERWLFYNHRNKTMVGTLPVLRAFAGDNNDYVSPYVFFDEFGPVHVNPRIIPAWKRNRMPEQFLSHAFSAGRPSSR